MVVATAWAPPDLNWVKFWGSGVNRRPKRSTNIILESMAKMSIGKCRKPFISSRASAGTTPPNPCELKRELAHVQKFCKDSDWYLHDVKKSMGTHAGVCMTPKKHWELKQVLAQLQKIFGNSGERLHDAKNCLGAQAGA